MAKTSKVRVMCDTCGHEFQVTQVQYYDDSLGCPKCESTEIVDWEPEGTVTDWPYDGDDGPSDADPGL